MLWNDGCGQSALMFLRAAPLAGGGGQQQSQAATSVLAGKGKGAHIVGPEAVVTVQHESRVPKNTPKSSMASLARVGAAAPPETANPFRQTTRL